MSNSNSNINTDTNSNPHNSANNSPDTSQSRLPYGGPVTQQYNLLNTYMHSQRSGRALGQTTSRNLSPFRGRLDTNVNNGGNRPPTPGHVYIVTSSFISQTTTDGVRLSESDIVGYQILAVFARVEDANSYAENECEEIDAGVRRRRSRRPVDGSFAIHEGDGIRAEAIAGEDGTVSWRVEDVGHIEVGQWAVQ